MRSILQASTSPIRVPALSSDPASFSHSRTRIRRQTLSMNVEAETALDPGSAIEEHMTERKIRG